MFDGAIAIEHFVMGNLGAPDMEVSFKGEVEPISMPLLAKAFGWPEFAGTIAASIPGVRLKDNVLTFDGNVESQVFGGRIVGSNIRLQDPLGNFPKFFADVRARDLDLELVTRTFEVGTHHRKARGRRAGTGVVRAGRRRLSMRASRLPRATNRGIASAPRR